MIAPGQTIKPLVKLGRKAEDCWPWIGAKNEQGRAVKCLNGTNHSAQRWLWETLFGPLSDDVQVTTKCGDMACANPHHLRAVSRAEIQQERSGLTPGDVIEIRHLAIKCGYPHDLLARKFEQHPATITKIVKRTRWKNRAAVGVE